MKCRRQPDRHGVSSSPVPSKRLRLLVMILGCQVAVVGCTTQWRSVDLRGRDTGPGLPGGRTTGTDRGDPSGPWDFPTTDREESGRSSDTAADWGRDEVTADFRSDRDGGSDHTVAAVFRYQQDPATELYLSPETPDSAVEETLTIEQVLEVALANHPLLRERQQQIEIARSQLVGAGLLPNPRLVMDTDSPVHESRPTDFTARVEFTLPTWGKQQRRRAVAAAGIVRAELALSRETEAVMAEAADAALEVLYLQELLELQDHLSKTAAKGAKIQQNRFEAGATSKADTVQADMDAANVELARRATVAQLSVARVRLSRAMGMTRPQLAKIKGELFAETFAPVPLETVLTVARRKRPELAEAHATVSQSQHQLSLAYAEARPDLTIGPRYQDRLGTDDDQIGARLNIDLPFFNRNQDGIFEGIARIRANRAQSSVIELTTFSDVASAYLELTSLQSSLQYFQDEVLPLAERTQADFLEEFGGQAIEADQVSALLQELIKMRVSHLQLRYRCDRLRTRLELLLGRRIADLQSTRPSTVQPEVHFPGPPAGQPDLQLPGQPEPMPLPLPMEGVEVD